MESTKIEVRVSNLDCEHDAANIERGLEGFAGLVGLKVYRNASRFGLYPDQTNLRLETKTGDTGFPPQRDEMGEQPKLRKNSKVLTAFFVFCFWSVGHQLLYAALISTIIFIAAILIGGYYLVARPSKTTFERRIDRIDGCWLPAMGSY